MLTADQVQAFRRLGYLPLGQVVEPQDVPGLIDAFDRLTAPSWLYAAPEGHLIRAEAPDGHVRVGLHLCHVDTTFRAFAADPSIAARISALFGTDVVVLTSLLFNKPPGNGQPLALHQDLPYYPYLGDEDLITCWTALDPVGPDNGPVEYVPGSHRARLPHRHSNAQQALDIVEEGLGLPAPVSVTLSAGQAVAHHGLTVHRSGPNLSNRPRRGLATLYIRASVVVSITDFPYRPIIPGA